MQPPYRRRSYFFLISLLAPLTSARAEDNAKITLNSEEVKREADGAITVPEGQIKNGRIKIAPAQQTTLHAKVVASAKVTFDDVKVAHIFSPATGRIDKILAKPGDVVKKGDPLAVLESPDLGSAVSDMLKAKADLTAAEHDYKRQNDLAKIHAAAQRDLEQAQDNYERAKAEMGRAQLKSRMWHITKEDVVSQHFTLRSPIDGEVLMRNVNPGAEVQGIYAGASGPNELFTVGDISTVWVMGDFYEADMAKVKPGQDVVIKTVAYPNDSFAGTIAWVSSVLDPALRTAKFRCQIANPEHKLKPEMFVSLLIDVGSKAVLTVPKQAIVRLSGQAFVFVPLDTKPVAGQVRFRPVPVQTGDEDSQHIEVSSGDLKQDQGVVVDGALLLSNLM